MDRLFELLGQRNPGQEGVVTIQRQSVLDETNVQIPICPPGKYVYEVYSDSPFDERFANKVEREALSQTRKSETLDCGGLVGTSRISSIIRFTHGLEHFTLLDLVNRNILSFLDIIGRMPCSIDTQGRIQFQDSPEGPNNFFALSTGTEDRAIFWLRRNLVASADEEWTSIQNAAMTINQRFGTQFMLYH